MKKRGLRKIILVIILALVVIAATGIWYFKWLAPKEDITYGATFSNVYAEYLELDWREVYIAGMDDLGIEAWRIPVYWSEIEVEPNVYDFEDLDWMMDEAATRGVDVTLAVGLKVPRWPECFLPDWAKDYEVSELDVHTYALLKNTVDQYKDHEALHRWQIENEPFFPFGECPSPSPERIADEFEIVRRLDPGHPIQSTTSGEQSLWIFSAERVDILGISLYREVHTPVIGPFVFPHSPVFYSIQRAIVEPFIDEVIVSELQAEPWFDGGLYEQSGTTEDLYAAFPVEDLEANVAFAQQVGVSEVYFWGVEWWARLAQQGEPRLWDGAREIINE
ncbi:hypothetical protein HON52_04505 [Candidatus Uhrbacteria bacterium]|jgi:hypothetical protein|nr:hypothetical protein [Candidatus Uhrbacteria bacterium]